MRRRQKLGDADLGFLDAQLHWWAIYFQGLGQVRNKVTAWDGKGLRRSPEHYLSLRIQPSLVGQKLRAQTITTHGHTPVGREC